MQTSNLTAPAITVSDLRQLLAAPHENPVLYLDEHGDLDVWAEAYVPHHAVIVRQHDLLDMIGEDTSTNALQEAAEQLQDTVDEIVHGDV